MGIDTAVEKLLITDSWGFLIIKTQRKLFVYTLTGTILAGFDFDRQLLEWTSYVSRSIDLVVALDADMKLIMFEALCPTTMEAITKMKEKVMTMKVDPTNDVLVLVTVSGKAMALPLPSPK